MHRPTKQRPVDIENTLTEENCETTQQQLGMLYNRRILFDIVHTRIGIQYQLGTSHYRYSLQSAKKSQKHWCQIHFQALVRYSTAKRVVIAVQYL